MSAVGPRRSSQTNGGGERIDVWAYWEYKWPVFDPSKRSPLMERWDVLMFAALLITAVLSPFETALLKPSWGFLLYLNLCINLLFLVDTVLQFMTAFPDPKRDGKVITRPRAIIRHYVSTTFIVDIIAATPFDLILLLVQDDNRDGGTNELVMVRLLRLFRLFRLLRLTHLSALMHRWQASVGINYSSITMIKLLFHLFVCCHWIACIWALTLQWSDDKVATWMSFFRNTKEVSGLKLKDNFAEMLYESPAGIYVISLYWATMTTATIGYGDVQPRTQSEYWVASACMLIAALVWAVILGEVCTIIATLAPHEISFKRTMDDLNRLMEDQRMPQDMRRTLRTYFHYGKKVKRYMDQLVIVDQMSPMLQGKVSMHLHNPWLAKVWYLQGLPTDTVVAIARELHVIVLAPQEEVRFGARKLFIVRRGVCVVGVRVKSGGEMWGEDMVLHNPYLREQVLTRALSYMDVLTLDYHDLISAIETSANPQESLQKIHWARACMALRRGMVKIAMALKNWEYRTGMSAKRISKDSLNVLIQQAVSGCDFEGAALDLTGSIPEVPTEELEWLEEADRTIQPRDDSRATSNSRTSPVSPSGLRRASVDAYGPPMAPVSSTSSLRDASMGEPSWYAPSMGSMGSYGSVPVPPAAYRRQSMSERRGSAVLGSDFAAMPALPAMTKRSSMYGDPAKQFGMMHPQMHQQPRSTLSGAHFSASHRHSVAAGAFGGVPAGAPASSCHCISEADIASLFESHFLQFKRFFDARLEDRLSKISC